LSAESPLRGPLREGMTMKAIRFHEHGGPEVLRLETLPDPVPGPGEAIVRVRACALNHLDVWERRGLPGIAIPLPHIPGSDVAGYVESVGEGVGDLQSGQKTLVCPGLSCMRCPACWRGQDSRCPHYSVLGLLTDGGYAERIRIPAVNALPYPSRLQWTDAASIPLVFLTAWHMLRTRCALQPGEDVLVIGAGSGVGSAAVQIAKLCQARVIATVGSDEKVQKAYELGADFVIQHTRQRIRDAVLEITSRRGVDIAFEHVGAAIWEQVVACLARGGRLVTCGATTGHNARLDIRHLFAREISILGSYMGSRHELVQVLDLVERGFLKPVVSKVYPLAQAAQAHARLEARSHFGKVVLAV